MVPLILFGLAAVAILAYSEGQKSGVDATPRQLPPVPAGDQVVTSLPTPTHKPGSPPPPTTAANILERKRLIVARGFQAAIERRQKRRPSEARQASLNAVAAQFRSKGVPLEKPNPALAFWKQSEKQIADQVATVVNIISGYHA